jgi:cell fate (sporulation/competence/biofilm development) regulator YlbF (YheA/YmcA/DUF963 family)
MHSPTGSDTCDTVDIDYNKLNDSSMHTLSRHIDAHMELVSATTDKMSSMHEVVIISFNDATKKLNHRLTELNDAISELQSTRDMITCTSRLPLILSVTCMLLWIVGIVGFVHRRRVK